MAILNLEEFEKDHPGHDAVGKTGTRLRLSECLIGHIATSGKPHLLMIIILLFHYLVLAEALGKRVIFYALICICGIMENGTVQNLKK